MPFDGIVTKSITDELNTLLSGGRIDRAFQTEKDEIILHVRSHGENYRLLLSANSSFARVHITNQNKPNPSSPPVFCMLLRKHIVGGKIDNFKTYDYDRILEVSIIAFNDFGEPCTKYLILEIMGKHSNIILLNENRVIIDSVKRIDNYISSVREVMPGRQYQLPPSQNKISPENIFHNEEILNEIFSKPENMELKVDKFILGNITGFSP